MIVFGGRGLGKWLGHEFGVLTNRKVKVEKKKKKQHLTVILSFSEAV